MEIVIILVVCLLIGLWALGGALRLVGALIGAAYLFCCPEPKEEPKQEPQGYTLDEILAEDFQINLN